MSGDLKDLAEYLEDREVDLVGLNPERELPDNIDQTREQDGVKITAPNPGAWTEDETVKEMWIIVGSWWFQKWAKFLDWLPWVPARKWYGYELRGLYPTHTEFDVSTIPEGDTITLDYDKL